MRSVLVNRAASTANPGCWAHVLVGARAEVPGGLDEHQVVGQRQQPQSDRLAGLVAAQHISFPALLEVQIGKREPVHGLGDRAQPPAGRRSRRDPAGQQTQARMLAAADAAAQLMQLADSEPVGVHHQHDRGVGDVDADLNDGGTHQHIDLACAKSGHRGVLLVGRQPPVHEPQPQVRQLTGTQSGVKTLGGLRRPRAGLPASPGRRSRRSGAPPRMPGDRRRPPR